MEYLLDDNIVNLLEETFQLTSLDGGHSTH